MLYVVMMEDLHANHLTFTESVINEDRWLGSI